MKYFLTLLIACVFLNGFSQNNVYIITEKFDGLSTTPTYDSVFVTDPSGLTSVQIIPHANINLKNHNSALNIIFNNTTQLGYRMVENGPLQLGYSSPGYYTHTWYFCQPWTSAGLEPAGANNSQFEILEAFPNPCKSLLNVKFSVNTEDAVVVIINSAGYIVEKIQLNGSDFISIDFSRFSKGTYFIRLINSNYYSEAIKVVREWIPTNRKR